MGTSENNRHIFNTRGNNGIGFALLLILLGSIFLLLNLNIIPIELKPILISWQMLLIAIGIWCLIKRNYLAGIILIAVGGFFIYPSLSSIYPQYFAEIDIDFETYWPVFIIILGAIIIFSGIIPSSKRHRNSYRKERLKAADYDSGEYLDKNVMFGGAEHIILSQNFKGGEGNVMFGELIIDLRKTKPTESKMHLELNAMFGSIILYVPSNWKVDLHSSTIFGSFQNLRISDDYTLDETAPEIFIKGSCMFGSGEIRN